MSPAHWTGWQAGLDQRSKGIWYQLCLFITSTSVQTQQTKFVDDSHVCLKSLLKPNSFFLMPPRHRNHSVFIAGLLKLMVCLQLPLLLLLLTPSPLLRTPRAEWFTQASWVSSSVHFHSHPSTQGDFLPQHSPPRLTSSSLGASPIAPK